MSMSDLPTIAVLLCILLWCLAGFALGFVGVSLFWIYRIIFMARKK